MPWSQSTFSSRSRTSTTRNPPDLPCCRILSGNRVTQHSKLVFLKMQLCTLCGSESVENPQEPACGICSSPPQPFPSSTTCRNSLSAPRAKPYEKEPKSLRRYCVFRKEFDVVSILIIERLTRVRENPRCFAVRLGDHFIGTPVLECRGEILEQSLLVLIKQWRNRLP